MKQKVFVVSFRDMPSRYGSVIPHGAVQVGSMAGVVLWSHRVKVSGRTWKEAHNKVGRVWGGRAYLYAFCVEVIEQ